VPELVFFVGKGGVGKTTVSSAYAVRRALEGKKQRVLLISTDPAHSLSDAFETRLGDTPTRVPVGSRVRLTAWEINSEQLFRSFIDKHKRELTEAVERGSLFTADEISSLLDTALPGMSEMGALLAIQNAVRSRKYSTIVVDTAPFGHTLRLFGLPGQFEKLLNFVGLAAERDQVLAQHFGGNAAKQRSSFVDEWRQDLDEIKQSFAAAEMFLVTTAEEFALNESLRCIRTLQDSDPAMKLNGVVLNRVVRKSSRCLVCRVKEEAGTQAQSLLRKTYKRVSLYFGEDPGFQIQGTARLKEFGDSVFGNNKRQWRSLKMPSADSTPPLTPAEWPVLSTPLTFVLGKGGVGKTTISAALGFRSRQTSEDDVEICSVDPAPSLDDVFQTEVSDQSRPVLGDRGFCASELDSIALYRNWVAEMRSEIDSATSVRRSGVQVDLSYERQLFSELLEIVPPGLDEILAIFRIMEMSQNSSRRLIIDMAPTGHALELLRTPERILVWSRLLLKSLASHRKLALAREVAVKVAELEVRARELSHALASAEVTVYAVMLPEALPDRETERSLQELKTLGIKPGAVFINRVIVPNPGGDCVRCRRAAVEQAGVLQGLKPRLGAKTVYVIPALEKGPAGKRGLREITRKIWQLN
jgi:arsenite/tail-anchored protein-transporting ATPase